MDRWGLRPCLGSFISFFFLISLFSSPAEAQIIPRDIACKWKDNLTEYDIRNLPGHKVAILEDCLYYYLGQKSDKAYGKVSSLILLPPVNKSGEKIPFEVSRMVVRQMWMNEVWREMHINGYMLVSWTDKRLTWDKAKWKASSLKIKSFGHLWMPDIYSDRYQTSVQSNDFTLYQDTKVVDPDSGKIQARLEYRMQANCEVDYAAYPADRKHCCFSLRSYAFRDLLHFKVPEEKGQMDLEELQTNWDVLSAHIAPREDDEDGSEFLRVCVDSGRKSSTLRIELTIPIVISALLVLVAPLFGPLKHQLWVKLFALLLQFLCFQSLVNKTPQIGFGDEVPRLYRFYEFTLIMTIVSLLVTVAVSALGRLRRSLPPPHSLLLASGALNGKLCCSPAPHEEKEGGGGVDNEAEWRQVFGALNNALSLLLCVIYVIALFVLLA